jgi:methylated-DNA-[protein]-cysteine S-methyltransferase
MRYSTMDTPAGALTIVVGDTGAVRASGFTADVQELIGLIHPSLRADAEPVDDVGPAQAAVRSYLDGALAAIDDVPVEQRIGGAFITGAWKAMRDIPAGAPVTYTRFAELSGRPAAVRGAASAKRGGAVRAVPPGAAHGRLARRVPLGAAGQAVADRPRGAPCRPGVNRANCLAVAVATALP